VTPTRHGQPFIPSERETLLLRAALLDGPEALRSWKLWSGQVPLETAEEGSYRLYPLVYKNLLSVGEDFPGSGKLKGAYRHTWYRNQLLLHRSRNVLGRLCACVPEMLVFKGLSLALQAYGDVGVRVMNDVDILVRRHWTMAAYRLLVEHGSLPGTVDETWFRRTGGINLAHPSGLEIDLHSYLFHRQYAAGVDWEQWRASRPLPGWPVRVLHPADELLLAIHHGASWNSVSPIRWAADAFVLIRKFGGPEFWSRFEEQACKRLETIQAHLGLAYLRSALGVDVPVSLPGRLRNRHQAWYVARTVSVQMGGRRGTPLGDQFAEQLYRSRLVSHRRRSSVLLCFLRAVAAATGAPTVQQTPVAAARRAFGRVSKRLRPRRS